VAALTIRWPDAIMAGMAELGAKARANLPDSAFAYIDSAGRRRLPIHDEAHVRNALARFGRIVFDDESARDRARDKLLRAAKRHGIVPIGFISGELRPQRRLPTGQVTLLFADIEASSRHLTELEDRYPALLSATRRIMRGAVRGTGGHEVDARADEFLAAFGAAGPALDAAIAIQRAIGEFDWGDGRTVRVRIGLHTGRPTLGETGYVGIAVNTGARVCGAGHGGQILVSRSARAAIGPDRASEFRPLGRYRLRGIPDEHELFQALASGLDDDFPALRPDSAEARLDLDPPRASLHGRDAQRPLRA
jgi:class 3 adenylate cyclase